MPCLPFHYRTRYGLPNHEDLTRANAHRQFAGFSNLPIFGHHRLVHDRGDSFARFSGTSLAQFCHSSGTALNPCAVPVP